MWCKFCCTSHVSVTSETTKFGHISIHTLACRCCYLLVLWLLQCHYLFLFLNVISRHPYHNSIIPNLFHGVFIWWNYWIYELSFMNLWELSMNYQERKVLQGWIFLHILFYKTRYYTTQLDIAFYHKHTTHKERVLKKTT